MPASRDRLFSDDLNRALGRVVKPIARTKDGSRGMKPFGSAFLLEHAGELAAVTAAHVVDGTEPRFLGLTADSTIRWPSTYSRVCAKDAKLPDPDVATAVLTLPARVAKEITHAIQLSSVLLDHVPTEGMMYLAVGNPVSQSKMRYRPTMMNSGTAFFTDEAVSHTRFAELNLHPHVHLAMHYHRDDLRASDGARVTGPMPNGMSGGPLFVCMPGQNGRTNLHLVGVLTTYRKGPPELFVATRIAAALEHLAPFRAPEERVFAIAD